MKSVHPIITEMECLVLPLSHVSQVPDKGLSHKPAPDHETRPTPLLHLHIELEAEPVLSLHNCSPAHKDNLIIRFADDTTVVRLISKGDEADYREKVLKLTAWWSKNNLALNTKK